MLTIIAGCRTLQSVKRVYWFVLFLLACIACWKFRATFRRAFHPYPVDEKTVAQRVAEFGVLVDARVKPAFESKGVSYPPVKQTWIALKNSKLLQIYAAGSDRRFVFIRSYPILAASGHIGPKLQEGDSQVPEGIYQIESLNPNSLYHLSMRVNYPNAFDLEHAKLDKRTNLGGDIMIHGKSASIGCLAMGDPASEDLFLLATRTGISNVELIFSPVDFRKEELPPLPISLPGWTKPLYDQIKAELRKFPEP